MAEGDRVTDCGAEPFLLWRHNSDKLHYNRDQLKIWLWDCGRFTPYLASHSIIWPGGVLVGLSSLAFLVFVNSPSTTPNEKLISTWFVLLALGIGTLGLIILIQSWRGHRLRLSVISLGQMIVGRITQVTGRTVTYSGSRETGTGEATSFYIVTVDYEFQSPHGDRLWGREEAIRNDLDSGLMLPNTGQTMLVIYLDDSRFVML